MRVNLGCGPVYVDSADWLNLDFVTNSKSVLQANLLEKLPVDEGSAKLVYSSHFLEHIPKPQVMHFLAECLRVLKPGGVLRLVLPDLEEMARSYLMFRDAGEHKKADFLVVEMVDQCVRRESGGELGKLYRHLRGSDGSASRTELIDFVRVRTGEQLTPLEASSRQHGEGGGLPTGLRSASYRGCHGDCSRLGFDSCSLAFHAHSARKTSAWRALARDITGFGISINFKRCWKMSASQVSQDGAPTPAQWRTSLSIRSISMQREDRAKVWSRCTWRHSSRISVKRYCISTGELQ